MLKTVEMMSLGATPPALTPPHSPQQPCVHCGELQTPGHDHLSGSKVGAEHQLHPQDIYVWVYKEKYMEKILKPP